MEEVGQGPGEESGRLGTAVSSFRETSTCSRVEGGPTTVITIAKAVCYVPGFNTGERHVLWGFPFSGEETTPCRDEVTNISWPEVAKPGLDHLVSNYRSGSLGC